MDLMPNAEANTALYHRLLNCGFRLTGSAGTDVFLNRVQGFLPGHARVYVKIDGDFTYPKWIAALRAGRSFVTSGPILEFTAGDKNIGEVLHLRAPGEVRLRATVSSLTPIDRIEVLHNGSVIAQTAPSKDGLTTQLDKTVTIDRSGWLALRAGKGEFVLAHSSPVYVEVAGKPAGSADDARYFLKWIDRLADAIQERDRIPGERWKSEVAAEMEKARKVYREIIERAEK
jgi:hypothetical protein